VDEILALRARLRGAAGAATGTAGAAGTAAADVAGTAATDLARLKELQHQLALEQGEQPLVLPSVDEQAVASVVADWTGIPVGRMVKDEIQAVLTLADSLEKRVIGQRQ